MTTHLLIFLQCITHPFSQSDPGGSHWGVTNPVMHFRVYIFLVAGAKCSEYRGRKGLHGDQKKKYNIWVKGQQIIWCCFKNRVMKIDSESFYSTPRCSRTDTYDTHTRLGVRGFNSRPEFGPQKLKIFFFKFFCRATVCWQLLLLLSPIYDLPA